MAILFALLPFNKFYIKIVKLKKSIFPLLVIVFLLLMVIFSESSFKSAHTGFMLWANNVFPSLLPFFICIELIKSTNLIEVLGKILEPLMRPLFNVPGCGAFATVLGITSGYPVGAKIVTTLREEKNCTKTEAERLLAFTNTSGPLFIIGSVGVGMFGSSKVGLLLLATHFISSICVGFLFRFYHHNDKIISQTIHNANSKPPFKISMLGNLMALAIKNSISTLLLICGYMIFFSVFSNILKVTHISLYASKCISFLLNTMNFSFEMSEPIFSGIIEVTGGISELAKLECVKYFELLPCVAFVLGCGGISVCMQVNSIISNTDLSIKPYIIGKTLQGMIAGVLTYFIARYTNFLEFKTLEIMSYSTLKLVESSNLLICAIAFIILACILVNQFIKRKKIIYKKDIV